MFRPGTANVYGPPPGPPQRCTLPARVRISRKSTKAPARPVTSAIASSGRNLQRSTETPTGSTSFLHKLLSIGPHKSNNEPIPQSCQSGNSPSQFDHRDGLATARTDHRHHHQLDLA